jgi:hypothetical protein
LRVRVTSYTSGTVEGIAYGHRDENSSGLISSIGPVTLVEESTKVIGTVNLAAGPDPLFHQVISTAGLNATSVKTSAAKLVIFNLVNSVATMRFFKLYNKSSAPIVGTDAPFATISMSPNAETRFAIPASGLNLSAGLAYGITLGVADNNTTPDTVEGAVTGLIAYI